jgi:thiamine-phosphate diphosphorylase
LKRELPRLYLVTTHEIVGAPDFLERAKEALASGGSGSALQLRAHGLEGGALWDVAHSLAGAARRVGAELWINDRTDVAVAVRADGVQLGKASLPTREVRQLLGRGVWIGRSVHAAAEAEAARAEGADMALLGHIYSTVTHRETEPLGPATLRQASTARPIVAIGGITPERVAEVMEAGAWGVAVLSGVWSARDPGSAVRRYAEAIASASERR